MGADKEDKNLKLGRFKKRVNKTEHGLGALMENDMKNVELQIEIVDNEMNDGEFMWMITGTDLSVDAT